jgi:hypothetical protein
MTRAEREPVSIEDTRQLDLVQRSIAAHHRAAVRAATFKRKLQHWTAIEQYKAAIGETPSDFGRNETTHAARASRHAISAKNRAHKDKGIK